MATKKAAAKTSDDQEKKLTAKEQRFVDEFVIDNNATQAAIRAGYSKKTASQIAYELLGKPHIEAAIDIAKAAISERTKVDADWMRRRLFFSVDADIADIYNLDGTLKHVKDWPEIWRKGLVSGIKIERTIGKGAPKVAVVEVKLADRTRLVELLGQHIDVGAFRKRIEHTGKNGGPIEVAQKKLVDLTDEELALIATSGGEGTADSSEGEG